MLAFPSQTSIYVATEYTDFRKGIDGLQERYGVSTYSGDIIEFCV